MKRHGGKIDPAENGGRRRALVNSELSVYIKCGEFLD
jgi:hypothetical protein